MQDAETARLLFMQDAETARLLFMQDAQMAGPMSCIPVVVSV